MSAARKLLQTTDSHARPSRAFEPRKLLVPPVARAAYSDRTSWLMAKCSELAYFPFERDLEGFDRELASGGFTRVAVFNSADTQGYLAMRHDLAVLAFRGTEANGSDIRTDLNVRFFKKRGTEVHHGFLEAFRVVEREVVRAVRQIGDLPLYITGHSLGGALATIATWNFDSDRIAACYTFGSPRVGEAELDGEIKTPVYRVVNASDIVARLPLMTMGYQHVGDLKYLTTRGELIRSPSDVRLFFRFLKNLIVKWRAIY